MQTHENPPGSILGDGEPLLDVNAVSRLLNIKPCTLYAWAAQGRTPCLKIHGLCAFGKMELTSGLKAFESDRKRLNPLVCVRVPLTSTG